MGDSRSTVQFYCLPGERFRGIERFVAAVPGENVNRRAAIRLIGKRFGVAGIELRCSLKMRSCACQAFRRISIVLPPSAQTEVVSLRIESGLPTTGIIQTKVLGQRNDNTLIDAILQREYIGMSSIESLSPKLFS